MYDVITVGSATVDVFATTAPGDERVIDIKSGDEEVELMAYPLGSKIIITHQDSYVGGGGTNAAAAFSKLDLRVGYVGKIGKDVNGYQIMQVLKEEGIDYLGTVGKRSGFSFILDSQAHDRTVFTYKGCNNYFRFNEVDQSKLDAKWLYASSMVEESFNGLCDLASHMKGKGVQIAFNPSCYLAKRGANYLNPMLKVTDLIIMNAEEAQLLVGAGEMYEQLSKLRELGPVISVITDGAHGTWASDGERIHHVKPHEVHVVEATGAGDAYGSTLVAGLLWGQRLPEAMRLAQINAEHIIGEKGAKQGLMRKEALLNNAEAYETMETTVRM